MFLEFLGFQVMVTGDIAEFSFFPEALGHRQALMGLSGPK